MIRIGAGDAPLTETGETPHLHLDYAFLFSRLRLLSRFEV
ncbi:hypothetical protein J2W55_004278 [Mucilaginibacter pocheonensis]|uniref:Uncharacterized protein n=1 Tax=Mucilaginibacter pocheonensis TaxID=398050 RepID=A0ABU1TG78_9SPHI|nr:hypothetical protein [Mucilaginibacter pocheonensis]